MLHCYFPVFYSFLHTFICVRFSACTTNASSWHQLVNSVKTALLGKEEHGMASTQHRKHMDLWGVHSNRTWKTQTHNKQQTNKHINNWQTSRENTEQWMWHRWSKRDQDRKQKRARFVYLQRGSWVRRDSAVVFPWDDPTGQWWPRHGPPHLTTKTCDHR